MSFVNRKRMLFLPRLQQKLRLSDARAGPGSDYRSFRNWVASRTWGETSQRSFSLISNMHKLRTDSKGASHEISSGLSCQREQEPPRVISGARRCKQNGYRHGAATRCRKPVQWEKQKQKAKRVWMWSVEVEETGFSIELQGLNDQEEKCKRGQIYLIPASWMRIFPCFFNPMWMLTLRRIALRF